MILGLCEAVHGADNDKLSAVANEFVRDGGAPRGCSARDAPATRPRCFRRQLSQSRRECWASVRPASGRILIGVQKAERGFGLSAIEEYLQHSYTKPEPLACRVLLSAVHGDPIGCSSTTTMKLGDVNSFPCKFKRDNKFANSLLPPSSTPSSLTPRNG